MGPLAECRAGGQGVATAVGDAAGRVGADAGTSRTRQAQGTRLRGIAYSDAGSIDALFISTAIGAAAHIEQRQCCQSDRSTH